MDSKQTLNTGIQWILKEYMIFLESPNLDVGISLLMYGSENLNNLLVIIHVTTRAMSSLVGIQWLV